MSTTTTLTEKLQRATAMTQLRYVMRVDGFREMNHRKLLEAMAAKDKIFVIEISVRVLESVAVLNHFGQPYLWNLSPN